MKDDTTHRQIAPRQVSGLRRKHAAIAMPEHVKFGLQMMAARERKSFSWMFEEWIYEKTRMVPPEFVGARAIAPVDPDKYRKLIDKMSRDKAARSKKPLEKRADQILERGARTNGNS